MVVITLLLMVSMTETTAATFPLLAAPVGRWLFTNRNLPFCVSVAATGSRWTGILAICLREARSMTEMLLSKRLHTYKVLPLGLSTGAVGVCPAGRVLMIFPVCRFITLTRPFGEAQVTYRRDLSVESASPLGSAGKEYDLITLPGTLLS